MTEPPSTEGEIALYVHWPYCARICPYCDFNVVRDRGRVGEQTDLVGAILADLDAQAGLIGPRRLRSIFFGGGTPSLMPPQGVADVVTRARGLFEGGPAEVTLEANPTDAEADRFSALAQAGVDRLSLGVQSLEDDALRFLGRNHSAAEARRAIALAGRAFARLSIDLIYARPGQGVAAWRDELRQAVDLGFEHVSPYQLTIEPTTAFGRAAARGALAPVDDDLAADLYEATQAVLSAEGFDAYEVSNHARGAPARSAHNLHVWRGGDYLGLGPGAHGRITRDGRRRATVAHRRIDAYVSGVAQGAPWDVDEALAPRDADEERVLLALRTVEGAPLPVFDRLGVMDAALRLEADGLLAISAGRVAATDRGRPVLDTVLRLLLT